ncbi:MAG: TrmH family RNA methyltransferase [Dehalococcoidia bacterium]
MRTDRMQDESLQMIPALGAEEAAAYAEGLALRALAEERAAAWVERCITVALEATHPFPRGEARIALQSAPADEVVAALLPPLTSQNRRLRRRAMTLLPRLDANELVRQMGAWLPHASKEGKRAGCVVLAAVGAPATPLLRTLARDDEPAVQRRAQRALAVLAERDAATEPRPASESALRPFGLRPPRGEVPRRPRSFAVAAFNFSYGVNLGVLIRSAEAAGAEAVWIVGRDFYYRPSTKGSDWWLPVEVIESPAACIERARREGYQIVALQQGVEAQPVSAAAWPEHPLIVVGNEGDGLPQAFLDAADLQVEIPVYGRIDSLNVAMAASVAMYAFRAAQEASGAP